MLQKIIILFFFATLSANCQIAVGDTVYVENKSRLTVFGVNHPKVLKLKIEKIDSASIEGKLINVKKGYTLVSKKGQKVTFYGDMIYSYRLNDIIYSKRFLGNPNDLKFTWDN